jgi:DNA-binding MarR family transcriptional regulator
VAEAQVNITAFWAVVKGFQDLDPAAKFAAAIVAAHAWDDKTTTAKLSLRDFARDLSLDRSNASRAVQRAVKNGALAVEKRERDGTTYRVSVAPTQPPLLRTRNAGLHQRNGSVARTQREKTVKRSEDKGAAAQIGQRPQRRPVDKTEPRRMTEADLLAGLAGMSQEQAFEAGRRRLRELSAEHRAQKGRK